MDGYISLSIQILVQGENSRVVMESQEPPGLLFIGGKWLTIYVFLL